MTIESNWCTLMVDNEKLHALMCLRAPSGDEIIHVNEEAVLNLLHEQGIVYGISDVAIQSLLDHALYNQFVCIAQGDSASRGTDGSFSYQKDTNDMKKKPLINSDGTVDYKNSLTLATISEGELLAIYIPATEGHSGMDIYGNVIPSPGKGRELQPLRGKGIVADDTKIHYYAAYSGHIVMDDNKIYIDRLYRVDGNLDLEIGNISFEGDVEVMGDVRSGLSIDSGGSIFIHGHVGGCTLNAAHNITIEKGIQGRGVCTITAGEDISCKFIEQATLKAEGNIYADSVLYSNLIAKNKINITTRHGNVVSSELYGMCGVVVKEAGNSAGAPTLLRAGLPRDDYKRAANLRHLIAEADAKTQAFNKHLDSINDPNKEIAPEKIANIRAQIMRAKIVLASEKKEHSDELSILEERIKADMENSVIDITGTVYEGVRIYIGATPFIVPETLREVRFKIRGVEVLAMPLEEST